MGGLEFYIVHSYKNGDQKDPSDQSIYGYQQGISREIGESRKHYFCMKVDGASLINPIVRLQRRKKMQGAITMLIYIYTNSKTTSHRLYTHGSTEKTFGCFSKNMLSQRHNNLREIRMQACLNYHGCFKILDQTGIRFLVICSQYVDKRLMYRIFLASTFFQPF